MKKKCIRMSKTGHAQECIYHFDNEMSAEHFFEFREPNQSEILIVHQLSYAPAEKVEKKKKEVVFTLNTSKISFRTSTHR